MKNFFTPMKIPQKQVWLLTASLLFGQTAFSSENLVPEGTAVAITQQNRKTVTGTVTDNFGPVIGASVLVKGTTNGVITDVDGHFTLEVPVGATLVISYVGYEDKTIVYKGEPKLNIKLNEGIQELQEVQIIAYGAQKKVTVTGAMASVNSKELLKTPVSSLSNALTGKMPGLSSIQSTGQPGADDPTIFIRGVGSLSTDLSAPLVLVDGVERSFNQIDPNEVEDITILKDASSTAVFGVRGANGVVLVTTKRGTEGKPRMNFSTSFAVQMPTRLPEFANSYEYATTYVNAQRRDGVAEDQLAFTDEAIEAYRTHSNPLAYPDTDWTDLLIKKAALQTQHNFSISGGSERVRYFASIGVFTQDGLFKSFEDEYDGNFKYTRYNYRMNLDFDLTKTTLMRINLGGRVNNKNQPNYEGSSDIGYLFRDIYWAPPMSGAGVVDGKWLWIDSKTHNLPGTPRDALYPYYGKGYNTRNGNTLNFDFQLEQKLDFLTKGLKAHVKASYNNTMNLTKVFTCSYPHYEVVANEDGTNNFRRVGDKSNLSYSESPGKARDWYLEFALNYKRDFDKHHVSALAMYNQSMTYYVSGPSQFASIPRSYIGFVGRVAYDWNNRYMADVNIGYNGSENFAPGNRFGLFPAFSLGWILTEENFMKPLKPVLDYLKIRASYGIVGNDRTSDSSRFLYLPDSYTTGQGGFYFGNTSKILLTGAKESKLGNPYVTWETAAKQNYGLDAYFVDSKLKLNFDYFIEHRKDILITRQVLPTYLAVTLPTANLGKVDNKGFEVALSWRDQINDFGYNIGFNISYAKNKVVFKDEVNYPYEYMRQTGRPVGQNFGYKYDGFFSEEDVANYENLKGKEGGIPDHGSGYTPLPGDVKYKDLNGDGKINQNDKAAIGYPIYPLLTGGLNLGFSYKGFDFSMTWAGATKTSRMLNDVYREPFGSTNSRSLLKYQVTDAWTPEKGNSAKAPAITFVNKTNNYLDSDLWLRDASYIRLKNVEVGYNFSEKVLKKLHVGNLRVYATGYNLLTFDKLKIVDPESDANGNIMYPLVMVVNLGLKVGF